MKPIKRLYLSNDEIHLADSNLVLEQSHCGRGFITAETTKDYTVKLVQLDVGYNDMLLRWFMGYVERAQPAETAISDCLCWSWSEYMNGRGHVRFSTPHYAVQPVGWKSKAE